MVPLNWLALTEVLLASAHLDFCYFQQKNISHELAIPFDAFIQCKKLQADVCFDEEERQVYKDCKS